MADPAEPPPPRRIADTGDDDERVLEVVIRNASLEHAAHVVAVGHFRGTEIAGAEAFLDACLGGRLARRQLFGLYPELIGDSLVMRNDRHAAPAGGLVIGLGAYGELSRKGLTRAFVAGLHDYALAELEASANGADDDAEERDAAADPLDEAVPLDISAILIGTQGYGALSVANCVGALVDGARRVNESLHRLERARGTKRRVWFRQLELVERQSVRAEEAARTLAAMKARPRSRRANDIAVVEDDGPVRLRPVLQRGRGATLGMPAVDAAAGWRRLLITRQPSNPANEKRHGTDLVFVNVGSRARADELTVTYDASTVQQFVDAATAQSRAHPSLMKTLFELLIPNDLKEELSSVDALQLVLDETSANFPWEALACRSDDGASPGGDDDLTAGRLALSASLIRQFRDHGDSRPAVQPMPDRALVIAHPPNTGKTPLPEAAREGQRVRETLVRGGWNTTALIWDEAGQLVRFGKNDPDVKDWESARAIVDAAVTSNARIVHIAAHGMFDPDAPAATGVVIGKDQYLTANVVRQLPFAPELVFLNCCYLGGVDATPEPRSRFAASIARALMGIGVRAVVAAGWAVDDAPAREFAEAFYSALLRGETFGAAVLEARVQAARNDPQSLTWAAYQCYGDPGFRLVAAGHSAHAEPPVVVSESDAVRLAGELRARTTDERRPNVKQRRAAVKQLDDLAEIVEARDDFGWDLSRVRLELADSYFELLEFERAGELYALVVADSEAPLRAFEQLGRTCVYVAQDLWRTAGRPTEGPVVAKATELATTALQHLAAVKGERGSWYAAVGSCHKKKATMLSGADRVAEMQASAAAYEAAAKSPGARPHYALNGFVMRALLGEVSPAALADIDTLRPDPAQRIADLFRHHATEADLLLARLVVSGGAMSSPKDVSRWYSRAFSTRSTWHARYSVASHVLDLADLVPSDHTALVPALGELRDLLAEWIPDADRASGPRKQPVP